MKIVIAPDSFKESLSAREAAEAVERGVLRVVPDAETLLVPMADGGEGTVQSLVDATGGRIETIAATDPLGESVQARFGILDDGRTAIIEMAAASGLPLVPPEKRDPRVTTTAGTGDLIRAALDLGARNFIVGIGGSATNDCGTGMAAALGVRFLDRQGDPLPPGGAALADLDRIDMSGLDARARESTFRIACDVDNPLTGPRGASATYGPQKGATPEMVRQLDACLAHTAEVIRRDLGKEINDLPGAGAAGGLGGGFVAFLDATLSLGVEIVLDATAFRDLVKGADLVITGEGRLDGQSANGKTPVGVSRAAKETGIPVIALCGSVGEGYEAVHAEGIDAAFSVVTGAMPLEQAFAGAADMLAQAAQQAVRLFLVGRKGK